MPFGNPIVAGTTLVRSSIHSPNYVKGVSGWSINADGTAQFNQLNLIIVGTTAAILIYNGSAGQGNLIGSWASVAGTDPYGNVYPAGLSASQATLTSANISSANIISALIQSSVIQGGSINGVAIQGGSIVETAVTFDLNGGTLLIYGSATSTVTLTSTGQNNWTAPAGNYSTAKVECWGDGGGGGGGGTNGAGGAGGGEYAAEPFYPITPGNVYSVNIGPGGTGGIGNGSDGAPGQGTGFDNYNVFANGGGLGHGATALTGAGGTGSTNTIHFNGGGGGSATVGGGGGGGGSGCAEGSGGTGGSSSTSSGGAGGSGPVDEGPGGAGGNAGNQGNNGTAPGGGGGGSGSGTSQNPVTHTYSGVFSTSYYGQDVGGNSRGNDGNMFQGNPNVAPGTFPGNEFTFWSFNFAQMATDLTGRTITKVTLTTTCTHTYNGTGATLVIGYTNRTNFPSQVSSFAGGDVRNVQQAHINAGQTLTIDVTSSLKAALAAATANAIIFGPGPNASDDYYCYMDGPGAGGTLNIAVTSVPNSGSNQNGGTGARGQIKITYASSTTLIAAISAQAGVDSQGNSYGAGFTGIGGTVNGITPGTNPTSVETWHSISAGVGYNNARWADLGGGYTTSGYRMHPDNTVELRIAAVYTVASATAFSSGGVVFTLPSAYRPTAGAVTIATMIFGANAAFVANQTQSVRVGSDGNVEIFGLNTSATNGQTFSVLAHGRFSVV